MYGWYKKVQTNCTALAQKEHGTLWVDQYSTKYIPTPIKLQQISLWLFLVQLHKLKKNNQKPSAGK